MENNTFKSSVFGGFNRQDVITYIEKTASESSGRIAQLEEENGALKASGEKSADEVRMLRAESAELNDKYAELLRRQGETEDALHTAECKLAAAEADHKAAQEEIAALRAELSGAKEELSHVRPLAAEYAELKPRITEIELEAHQRAEKLEQDARRRTEEMIGHCRKVCDDVLGTVGTVCAQVSGELRRADVSLSQLPSEFNRLRLQMEELEKSICE